ncbi:hypothetical protein IQ07DRAFT_315421 [Pyrenochaeta sp. DS3sAY3a]|nr:hypothetical protein IQ07DRAFT_315421 [Pyrenochaeta sp. DS3sAY3a]
MCYLLLDDGLGSSHSRRNYSDMMQCVMPIPCLGLLLWCCYILVESYQSHKARLISLCCPLALPLVTQAHRPVLIDMPQNI